MSYFNAEEKRDCLVPRANVKKKKGDRLCHVITPRDKAGALKEINKKASASYEKEGIFYKKTRRYKTGDEKKSGSKGKKKKKLRPGSKRGKEKWRRVKRGGGLTFYLIESFISFPRLFRASEEPGVFYYRVAHKRV